jgi:hypothetical protein
MRLLEANLEGKGGLGFRWRVLVDCIGSSCQLYQKCSRTLPGYMTGVYFADETAQLYEQLG